MYRHPIRKSLGLIVLYSIIIIGIFVLQFRNESVISKSIGLLSISMAQSQSPEGEFSLKNSLQVSFKGITFTADEVTPARVVLHTQQGPVVENLTLLSYEQRSPLSCTFNFTNAVSLTFSVSGNDLGAALTINAELPLSANGLYLNYKPNSGFSVTDKTKTKLLFNSKNLTYAFTASQISDKEIFLSARNLNAYYVAYDPSIEFSFATLDSDLIIAQKETYETNLKLFRANLLSSVDQSIKSSQTLSEKIVVAYVAELASQGKYTEAIKKIPDSFKKGNKRTYISAPYFNTLEAMLPTLEMHKGNMDEMISNALANNSLSIFSTDDLAEYINILPENQEIKNLLALPATILANESDQEQIKLSQVIGILGTYLKLSSLHSPLAEILYPAAGTCLSIIESNCAFNESILTLSEKEVPVSDYLALSAGNALIQWGEFNNAPEYSRAGYAIVNSILSVNTLDTITVADIYPVLINNIYYPHFKLLSKSESNTVWTWTCCPSVTYSQPANTATIAISFPKGAVHHAYICGIKPFSEIEIYGLSFHSDPRFESYNSSGFIYNEDKSILLLKSRHKNETELVRLTYK